MAAPSDSGKKTMDISKPGKNMPDTNARPTIVGHRTIMKDPMVNQGTSEQSGQGLQASDSKDTAPILKAPSEKTEVRAEKVVQPEDDFEAPKAEKSESEPEAKESEEEPKAEAEEPKAEEPKTETEEVENEAKEDEIEEDTTRPAEATDSINKDDDVSPAATAKEGGINIAEKELQEAAAKKEKLDKLVAEKTYFVPIGENKHKSSSATKKILIFIVLIVGLLALGDLAVDAGIIKTSIKPPISLFNNE